MTRSSRWNDSLGPEAISKDGCACRGDTEAGLNESLGVCSEPVQRGDEESEAGQNESRGVCSDPVEHGDEETVVGGLNEFRGVCSGDEEMVSQYRHGVGEREAQKQAEASPSGAC